MLPLCKKELALKFFLTKFDKCYSIQSHFLSSTSTILNFVMINNNSFRRPSRSQGQEKNTPCPFLLTSPLLLQVRPAISNKAARKLGQCEISFARINKGMYDVAYIALFCLGFSFIWLCLLSTDFN